MSDKSYVSMEQRICICCEKTYDTGAILLDQLIRDKFERYTTTGYGLCNNCKKEGFLLLIEADDSLSTLEPDGSMLPQNAYKTGRVMYVKKDKINIFFNNDICNLDMAFIDIQAFEKIRKDYEDGLSNAKCNTKKTGRNKPSKGDAKTDITKRGNRTSKSE